MLDYIFSRLHSLRSVAPLLGRWCIKDKSKNGWKIDMANVDHCGTCSYQPQKSNPIPKVPEKPSALIVYVKRVPRS